MPLIQGTSGADTLQGSIGADTIDGSGGNDLIHIGSGGSLPDGTFTYDTLLGGTGDDRFQYTQSQSGYSTIDGGAGVDTIDFTGHDSGFYFRSTILTLRDGPSANTIEGRLNAYQGLFSPPLDVVFMTASGVERIIASDVGIELDGFTQALDIVSQGGGQVWTGSGDDTITLATRVRTSLGTEYRTLYSSNINGGAGVDRLNLENQANDYLFVKTGSGWSIHDGRNVVHQISNIETVSFAGGAAITLDAAASGADFDSAAYLARYADLRAAYGADEVKAYQHWQQFGKAEGRIGSFDGLNYIASHRDLIAVFGTNAAAGSQHYVQYGAAEGRVVSFDPAAYAASNLDLARIIGTDATAAAGHYINYGVNEGRTTAGFDSVAYLLSNRDLAGLTPVQARTHWLTYGADEGRSGDALFGREQTSIAFTGASVTNQFETATDRDWFSITLPVYQYITFNGSAGVTGLSVYNATGRLIASDADGRDFRFLITNEHGATGPAPYYLVVNGGAVGDYTVTMATSPLNPGALAGTEAALIAANASLDHKAALDDAVDDIPFLAQTEEGGQDWSPAAIHDFF